MLPRKNRLIKKEEIEKVFQAGENFFSVNIGVKKASNEKKITRFCFVVGASFSKKATERNWAKRILRELAQERLADIKRGTDIIIALKKKTRGSKKEQRREIGQQFTKALKKAGLTD